jgi:hypothetical protein
MLKKSNNVKQGTITSNKQGVVRRVAMSSKQGATMLKKQGVARGVVLLSK